LSALLHVREPVGKRLRRLHVALQDIELEVQQGERLGLIGPNGSGQVDAGELHLRHPLRNEQGRYASPGGDDGRRPTSAPARPGRGSFQLPRPVRQPELARTFRIRSYCRQRARASGLLSGSAIDTRCLEMLGQVGWPDQGAAPAARP
jgi:branched-chain amino acid transport system ATP-binding protein